MTVVLSDLSDRTTSELRRAVEESGGEDLPRGTAVQELLRRDYPFKVRSFRKVVADEQTGLTHRLLAVGAIARVGGAEARAVLLEAARSHSTRVRREALWALGRIGDPADVAAIRRLALECGTDEPAAAFAELLIGFRVGSGCLPLETPARLYNELEGCAAQSISVRAASPEQVENGVWSLADEAFGVDPAANAVHSLDLADARWMVAFDRAAVERLSCADGDIACVLGLVSEEDLEDPGDFFLTCVLLAERACGRGRVAGYDRHGSLVLLGSLVPCRTGVLIRLRAVATPENPPLELDVVLRANGSADVVRAKIAPGLTRKVRLAMAE